MRGIKNQQKQHTGLKFKNMRIVIVPGSFKPPHKGHWEMVMSYVDKADKVIVLISNISRAAISARSLSMSNLRELGVIKSTFDSLYEDEKIKSTLDAAKKTLNQLTEKSNDLSFNELKKGYSQYLSFSFPDSPRWVELNDKFENYIKKLENSLFKSTRLTANSTEITPEMSKEIFEIFKKAYHVEDKVEVIIPSQASPVAATYAMIDNDCTDCKILLGGSKKNEDNKRWNNAEDSIENKTNILIPSAVEVKTMISSTDLRKNINYLEKSQFPDRLSDEDFARIKEILGVADEDLPADKI